LEFDDANPVTGFIKERKVQANLARVVSTDAIDRDRVRCAVARRQASPQTLG
jgi:hypothetical protein